MLVNIVLHVSNPMERHEAIYKVLQQYTDMNSLGLAEAFFIACHKGDSITVHQLMHHKYRKQRKNDRVSKIPFARLSHKDPITNKTQGRMIDGKTSKGNTALILASQEGHWCIVQKLLEKNALVNSTNDSLYTALMSASQWGHVKVVKLLLDANAFVDAKDDMNDTALIVSCMSKTNDHLKIVKLLLRECPNLEVQDIRDGNTALLECLKNQHFEMASILIRAGSSLSTCNHRKQSASMKVCENLNHHISKAIVPFFPSHIIKPMVPIVSLDRSLRLV